MRLRQIVHFSSLAVLSLLLVQGLLAVAADSRPSSSPAWLPALRKSAWVFYIGTWGNPAIDSHWAGWRLRDRTQPNRFREPPYAIPSYVFPALGLYSSHDTSVLRHHCEQIHRAGIDAIVLEWLGSGAHEIPERGASSTFVDATLDLLLDAAAEFHLSVALQIQPYPDRSSASILRDIEHIHRVYANRTSILRIDGRPVVSIYDPHTIQHLEDAIEQSRADFPLFLLATICDKAHVYEALERGFDGVVSFFASENTVWAANISNWKFLAADAVERDLLFVPTVAPGFSERKTDPWGGASERMRRNGSYYERMWRAAIEANTPVVAINSFNSWFEGYTIEPAVQTDDFPWTADNWVEQGGQHDYMEMTRMYVEKYKAYIPTPSRAAEPETE
jgi:glycoprotein endo-alpha-1,2-mannosidase